MIRKTTPVFKLLNAKYTGAALFCAALLFGAAASAQTTRFVKPTATGTADGSSWENASADIQLMINGSVAGDAIWVAAGTYKPNRKASAVNVITPNDRDNAYVIKDNVKLYGGFAGTEALLEERDLNITANASILSVDFTGDDELFYNENGVLTILNNSENGYHVLICTAPTDDPMDATTVIDGFTIKGGNANDAAFTSLTVNTFGIFRYTGGGVINRRYCSPTFANVIFTGNFAIYGGAVYNRTFSNAVFNSVSIDGNAATYGGGMTNWMDASPVLNNTEVSANTADAGGGIYNYSNSNAALNNVYVHNNVAKMGSGGGMFNNASTPVVITANFEENTSSVDGGGIYSTANSDVAITDATFYYNQAQNGGGLYNTGGSDVTFVNTYISFNEATTGHGGGVYNYQSQSSFTDVLVEGNSAALYGGGIANWSQAPSEFTNVDIMANMAQNAAGIFNYDNSPATLTNVTLFQNDAGEAGGGIYNYKNSPAVLNFVTITENTAVSNGGGVCNREGSNTVITNALIAGNFGLYGGGIYNYDDSSPILTNVTIAHNAATNYGGGIASDSSSPQIRNTIVYGNTAGLDENHNVFNFNDANPVFFYSLVEGSDEGWQNIGIDGGNNKDGDPLFADTEEGDYSITLSSPARNTGNNSYYDAGLTPDLSLITTDLAGNPRIYNGNEIDMGAYELQDGMGVDGFNSLLVTCYPNPVVNYLSIQAEDTVTAVAVYNMLGQEVKGATWNKANNTVDMAALQTGNYFVKVTVGTAFKSVLVAKK